MNQEADTYSVGRSLRQRITLALEGRLLLSPALEALRKSLPEGYISPLDAPPFSLGRISLFLLGLLTLSGLGLLLFYVPTPERAADSVAILHRDRPFGWLIHNTHRWSALLWLVTVFLHALRVWLKQAYAAPRDINWWLGLGLLLLSIAMGGSGYLLRWDIKAFTLMDLLVSNLTKVPVMGELLLGAMLGGSEIDQVPLYRGYAFHVWIIPLLLFLALFGHLGLAWRQGLASRSDMWERLRDHLPTRRIHELTPALAILIMVLVLSFATPHEGRAGPTDRSALPHPDWILTFYIVPFWFFAGEWRVIGALILPIALLGLLLVAPALSNRISRIWGLRLLALVGLVGVAWLLGQMAWMGYQVPFQGCSACHRPGILGGAPLKLSEFEVRDPDWLVFHLREPEISILTPSDLPPDQLP